MATRTEISSLTLQCATAYASGRESPFITSSPCDMAWRIGLFLRSTGRPAPQHCKPSRGYTWIVDGTVFSFANCSNPVITGVRA
jgi:hypothetical protein